MVASFDEAREQIEQDEPLMSEIEGEYVDNMARDIYYHFDANDDFFDLNDLYTEGVHEGAYTIDEIVTDRLLKGGSLPDAEMENKIRGMLENYQKTLKKYHETGFHGDKPADKFIVFNGSEYEFAIDETDAVEKMSGGYETIRSAARDEYFDQLEYEFDQDPIEFAQIHGLGGGQTNFKRGETRFAEYFPAGGYNYNENMLRFEDPTGMIDYADLPKAEHHGTDDYGTLIHTRQADFEGGRLNRDNVRYIGEIQLDANRKLMDSGDIPTPRENLISVAKARPELARIKEEESFTGARRGAVNDSFNNIFLLKLSDDYDMTLEQFANISANKKI